MAAPSPLIYLLGVLGIFLLGVAGRTFLVGVREQVIKAVVNTAVDTMLGGIKTGIQDLKDDMKLVKISQQTSAQANILTSTDMSALRTRVDDHLVSDEKWQDMERDHRIKVDDFMDWAGVFLKTHMHVGATATVAEPPALT